MAKALYGHLGADPVLISEVARLRRRVRELEDDLARLQEAQLAAVRPAAEPTRAAIGGVGVVVVDELIELEASQEPALT